MVKIEKIDLTDDDEDPSLDDTMVEYAEEIAGFGGELSEKNRHQLLPDVSEPALNEGAMGDEAMREVAFRAAAGAEQDQGRMVTGGGRDGGGSVQGKGVGWRVQGVFCIVK